jgi:hypothetical protein
VMPQPRIRRKRALEQALSLLIVSVSARAWAAEPTGINPPPVEDRLADERNTFTIFSGFQGGSSIGYTLGARLSKADHMFGLVSSVHMFDSGTGIRKNDISRASLHYTSGDKYFIRKNWRLENSNLLGVNISRNSPGKELSICVAIGKELGLSTPLFFFLPGTEVIGVTFTLNVLCTDQERYFWRNRFDFVPHFRFGWSF